MISEGDRHIPSRTALITKPFSTQKSLQIAPTSPTGSNNSLFSLFLTSSIAAMRPLPLTSQLMDGFRIPLVLRGSKDQSPLLLFL